MITGIASPTSNENNFIGGNFGAGKPLEFG